VAKCTNKELYYLYSSPNFIRVIKSRRMIWKRHIARMQARRGTFTVLVGNVRKRDNLEDLGLDGKVILKWVFQNLGCGNGLD
jgi:hypothetical protein